jgi:hypothetical protein
MEFEYGFNILIICIILFLIASSFIIKYYTEVAECNNINEEGFNVKMKWNIITPICYVADNDGRYIPFEKLRAIN